MKALITAAAALLFTGAAAGANLYKDGTEAHKMAAFIENTVPANMSVVFVQEGKPAVYGAQLDQAAVKRAGITDASMKHIDAVVLKGVSVQRATAHTVVDRALPENKNGINLCAIYFRNDREIKSLVGLTHESVHCEISTLYPNKEYIAAVMPVLKNEAKMTMGLKYGYFEEILVSAVVISMKDKKDIAAIYRRNEMNAIAAGKNYEGSTGYNSLKRLMELCPAVDSCSADPLAMTKIMTSDAKMLAAIEKDMKDFETMDFSVRK